MSVQLENPHTHLLKAAKDTKRSSLDRGRSWVAQTKVSILHVCRKPRNGKSTQINSDTCLRHSCHCQKTWKCIVSNGYQARRIQRSSSQWRKQTETVTSHCVHRWLSESRLAKTRLGGISLKQGATSNIHRSSAVSKVTRRPWLEVKTVACVLRWIRPRMIAKHTQH